MTFGKSSELTYLPQLFATQLTVTVDYACCYNSNNDVTCHETSPLEVSGLEFISYYIYIPECEHLADNKLLAKYNMITKMFNKSSNVMNWETDEYSAAALYKIRNQIEDVFARSMQLLRLTFHNVMQLKDDYTYRALAR